MDIQNSSWESLQLSLNSLNLEVGKSCCSRNKGFCGMHLVYRCNFQTFTRVLLVHVSISVPAVVYTLSPRIKLQLILKFFHVADNSHFLGPGQRGCEPCAKCSVYVGQAYRFFEPYCCPSALDLYR